MGAAKKKVYMCFKDVPVEPGNKSQVFGSHRPKRRYAPTPWSRLWKMLMKHQKAGYIVNYEEYHFEGRLCCRGEVIEV